MSFSSPVLVLLRAPPLVLVVVELRTRVALPAQPGWLPAGVRLVVGQHVGGVQPARVLRGQVPLLVKGVEARHRVALAVLDRLKLPDK